MNESCEREKGFFKPHPPPKQKTTNNRYNGGKKMVIKSTLMFGRFIKFLATCTTSLSMNAGAM
jgi:hypothetical protein